MSHFHILEDVQNENIAKNIKKKKLPFLAKDHAEKKYHVENRGILQPVNNGVRQGAKRPRLSTEGKPEDVICIDDSLKENIDLVQVNEEILKIGNSDDNQVSTKEEIKDPFPKKLLYVAEYRKDIWRYLQELEKSTVYPKSKYMLKQTDLSWTTRSILIDWLSSVAEEYKLCNETFHLSVTYIDKFLSNIAVVRTKFQLVGAAAMLLAGKMEEIYPIDVKEWSYLTGDAFTSRQVMKMEQLLAKLLKFKMQPPTISTFIEHFCHEHNLDSKTLNLAMYISELVLLEGDEYLNHLPSKLAASCIALARYLLAKERPWPKKFKEHCGYSVQQLSPVIQKQSQTFKDSPLKDQQAIQTKYKSSKYNQVALLKPKNLVLEDFGDGD